MVGCQKKNTHRERKGEKESWKGKMERERSKILLDVPGLGRFNGGTWKRIKNIGIEQTLLRSRTERQRELLQVWTFTKSIRMIDCFFRQKAPQLSFKENFVN